MTRERLAYIRKQADLVGFTELRQFIDELAAEVEFLQRTTVPVLSPKDQASVAKAIKGE